LNFSASQKTFHLLAKKQNAFILQKSYQDISMKITRFTVPLMGLAGLGLTLLPLHAQTSQTDSPTSKAKNSAPQVKKTIPTYILEFSGGG